MQRRTHHNTCQALHPALETVRLWRPSIVLAPRALSPKPTRYSREPLERRRASRPACSRMPPSAPCMPALRMRMHAEEAPPLASPAQSAPRSFFEHAPLHPQRGIRNAQFQLRVWIFDGQFGTMSGHVRGSPPPQSRGASPPDLSENVRHGFWVAFFIF